MAGPRPLEKCIALEPRGARRSGGPSTICPCLEHTTEYFLDPSLWHGGATHMGASAGGGRTILTRRHFADAWNDTRPVAQARLRPTGQALAVKPPLAWTLCKACARLGPTRRRSRLSGTRARAQRESDDNP